MRGLFYMQDSKGYKNHGLETIYIRITNCIFDYMVTEGLNKKYKGKNSAMMDTSNKITITESDIRNMVRESVYRILDESPNGRIGEYECKNGFLRTLKAPSLKQFGYFNDVRLYYSPSHTYCLLRREDNGTLFFAEIIDAPEIGKNDTKFVPRKPSEVPNVILRDAQSLLRKAKSQHTLLS